MAEPIRIEVAPVLVAGYLAAAATLAEHAVTVKDPRIIETVPSGLPSILHSPRAYAVYAFVLDYGIYVERTGRFGFDEEHLVVVYPVPHTDPAFASRLADVLVPTAERLLLAAAEQSHVERTVLGRGAPIEAWEAVMEVTR